MIAVLQENANTQGIKNINVVHKFWLETVVGKDISDDYDIVVSSNSIIFLVQKNK
jgi:hypothetical protein